MKPYIGITDFTCFDQVEDMLRVFKKHSELDCNRILHVGVMMSRKTLLGQETKWAEVFPKKESIKDIFFSSETFNCLHYADYDEVPDPNLAQHLIEAVSYGGENIHALQLDIPWPDAGAIAYAKKKFGKPIEIIIQVGGNSFEKIQDDPSRLIEYLLCYYGITERVLLDKSMGKGKPLDAHYLLPFMDQIQERLIRLKMVVAGGLGPNSLHLLLPIVEKYPCVSIDAQGKLRPSGDAKDPIDWNLAREYLIKALQILR